MATSSASSFLHCLSSGTVSSSFSASAGGLCASTRSSGSPRENCQLVMERLGDDRLLTSKPRSLQQNEPLVANEALSRSNGVEGGEERKQDSNTCPCRVCGRRGLISSLGGLLASTGNTRAASASTVENSDYNAIRKAVRPTRPEWYEKYLARCMAKSKVSYEAKVADYKRQLFRKLDEKAEHILELGIGAGPNLKYYGNLPNLQQVVGVDPNLQTAKYCADSATAAGLSDSQFEFLNAVGERIPVPDESMDGVVCTLTLCTVSDVTKTLEEIKRVLRPGGAFLFIEHVAAPEGTSLRFWQGLIDPFQRWFSDGCSIKCDTLQNIDRGQFSSIHAEKFSVDDVYVMSPHIGGIAYK